MTEDLDELDSSADVMAAKGAAGCVLEPGDLSLAIATAHTPWISDRARSMLRLQEQIAEGRADRGGGFAHWHEMAFCERMPNHVWSELIWRWALETNRTHALFLQDDVILAPRFFRILRAMLVAKPSHVIAFHVPQGRARDVFRERRLRWVTSLDGLVGWAYLMPKTHLLDFELWRATELRPRAAELTTEDSLLDAWALDRGVKLWHPVPTIVDHDVELASTYGNDRQLERSPTVTWKDIPLLFSTNDYDSGRLEEPAWWATDALELGRFFPKSHHVARLVLKDDKRAAAIALLHERTPYQRSPWVYP
jgi:hypothetical protein